MRLALHAALAPLRFIVVPHRVALARLLDMPLAVAGTGCIDFAAFHFHVLGWVVTGASLWVLEALIADDDPAGRG